jgi:serine/threonine protein phosphatase PrpC
MRVIAASVRGASHAKAGQPCQDAHAAVVFAGDILVAAVADGAGSAAFAGEAAAMAVRRAVETAQGRTREQLYEHGEQRVTLCEALREARLTLEQEAEARRVSTREFATTLIVLIATPEVAAAAQVGDGAAIVGAADGSLHALTAPQSGEYINETTFLTSPDALETAQFAIWRGTAAHLALLTDGLQRLALKMPEGAPHAPFFAPLFRFAAEATDETQANAQLQAFLRSPRITERADDDLTLLLACQASNTYASVTF